MLYETKKKAKNKNKKQKTKDKNKMNKLIFSIKIVRLLGFDVSHQLQRRGKKMTISSPKKKNSDSCSKKKYD